MKMDSNGVLFVLSFCGVIWCLKWVLKILFENEDE